MDRSITVLAVLVAGLVGGCETREYRIQVTPESGQQFRRELNARVVTRTKAGESVTQPIRTEVGPWLKMYSHGPETQPDRSLQLSGTFNGSTPDDVGGSGRFRRYTSALGDALLYVEQFRGDDNGARQVQHRFQLIDYAVDHAIWFVRLELKEARDLPTVVKFLDGPLRADLKNAILMAWLLQNREAVADLIDAEPASEPFQAGIEALPIAAGPMAYILRRGYIQPEQLPALIRLVSGSPEWLAHPDKVASDKDNPLNRFLIDQVGVADADTRKRLLALVDPQADTEARFKHYLRTRPAYKHALAAAEGRGEEAPDPMEVFLEPVKRWDLRLLADDHDKVFLTLKTQGEPVATNGTYDADAKAVRWDLKVATGPLVGDRLPRVCWALWVQPDEKAQKRLLGKSVLVGQGLYKYCLWEASLSAKERSDWLDWLGKRDTSSPAKLREQLKDSFSERSEHLAKGLEILLEVLEPTSAE